jgi:aromatic ring-opening dioxygenase catalytic subunit (LigB family)
MAELVGAFAASHGPLIIREWERVPPAQKARMQAGFLELGKRLQATRPDVLVVVAPDHWSNFFLDNIPAVCIGVGETHDGPPEPWMKGFPYKEIRGDSPFALHLAQTAMDGGFEPSLSHRLKLDHGFCIPLWRMGIERLPRIVPIALNSIEAPMPSLARCYEWGLLLKKAIQTFSSPIRVAVLGTGGLSHSIGEPTMGAIHEEFDRETIRRFNGSPQDLFDYLRAELPTRGNGSEEVRNWLVAHGAAGGRGFELVDYLPVPAVIVGCGFASWNI